LLTGIKRLLHDEGLTIRGVQKILREQGVRHVAGLSGEPVPDDIDMDAEAALEAALAANFDLIGEEDMPPEKAESATIHALETALYRGSSLAGSPSPRSGEPTAPAAFARAVDVAEAHPKSEPLADVALGPGLQDLRSLAEPHAVVEAKAEVVAQSDDTLSDEIAIQSIMAMSDSSDLAADENTEPAQTDSLVPAAPIPAKPLGLVERLRALPTDAFVNRQSEAHALRARLIALRRRMRRLPEVGANAL
jgi:hypothetical protein